ncbi:MAG: S9 family peptidase [Candidatus Eisenbacteria bacterium]|nr:S9 family peptidase [Candidatus Eisenbacteria bacterium]
MPTFELRGIPAEPPVADKKPVVTTLHGETRRDDYAWLRDKEDPAVLAYLEAENAYADAWMHGSQELQDTLYAKMLSRIQQTDLSVPYRRGEWLYYTRTEEGRQYAFHCRKRGEDGAEQMMLDVNALAEGHPFMAIGAYEVSPDGSLLAYSTDSNGYRQYQLRVKNPATGELLDVTAERVTSVAWSADGRTLFYAQEDAVSKRSYRLYRHTLGTSEHTLVYEELDERFDVYVSLTRSGAWLVQTRASHTTSEVCVLDATQPGGEWTMVAPRVQDREYFVEHRGGEFYIRANDTGRNYRIVTAPVASPSPEHWTELVAHRDHVMITGIDCFAGHLVWTERERALPQIVVMDLATRASMRVAFDEAAYAVGPGANEEFETTFFRYGYQSFLTPPSVYDLDPRTLESTMRKRTEVLGGWNPESYVLERTEAVAADGVRVPLTLLSRRDTPRDGSAPCLLYAYGSYGMSSNVLFNPNRFCLVDRGMVYALAHIRGGGDLGKAWHDDGRMANKKNTFTDFVACAEHLCATKRTSSDRLVAQGGSAGGLLMGAITNLRPDLFHGVLSQVPFVDCINTMLDESLPLTVGEFEEWGNPKVAEEYAWIRAYSPYDNLEAKAYPSILVKTSLNDSQVGYWEPAKYVAKLRTLKTDTNPLLFKCNMGAGHGGASGRYDALREIAFDYAWMLRQVGLAETAPRH